MATTHDTDMVMAYGKNGLELTPRSETVMIDVLPLGPGNECIPATIKCLQRSNGGGIPTKLLSVKKPSQNKSGHTFVLVRFECTPYIRYTRDDGTPSLGRINSCFLRHEADAEHEIFAELSDRERARMRLAVRQALRCKEVAP